VPAYEKAAQIAERFASWAENNPDAVKYAVGIAGGLVTIGTLGSVFMSVGRAVVDIQLIAATLMNKAADKQLAAATYGVTGGLIGPAAAKAAPAMSAGGGLIAGLLGVGAGVAGYDVIAGQLNLPTAGTIGKQIEAVAAYYIGNMFKNVPGQARPGDYLFRQITGQGAAPADASVKSGSATGDNKNRWWVQGLQEYTAFQEQLVAYQKSYNSAVKAEEKSTKEQLLQLNTNYILSNTRAIRDFTTSEARTEEDYYAARLKSAQDNGQQAYQAEQDHQIALRRLTEDHRDTMVDLTAARDGLGMIREMRSYEKARTRAEEDYGISASRRNQDYARQMTDMEHNFALQRSRRIADFSQQQADASADMAIQEKAINDAHKVKLEELAQNLKDENTQATTAFQNRLAIIDGYIGASGKALQAQIKITTSAYNAMIALLSGVPGKSGANRDTGGYTPPGMFANSSGRMEWVLDPSTTKYAEQIVGGRLTQQNLIAAMISGRGGGGGGGGTTYNDRRTQNLSGMTAQDRLLIKDMIKRGVNDKFEAELR
jgi:hypothetical protein